MYKFLCYVREDPTQWVDVALAEVMTLRKREDDQMRKGIIANKVMPCRPTTSERERETGRRADRQKHRQTGRQTVRLTSGQRD